MENLKSKVLAALTVTMNESSIIYINSKMHYMNNFTKILLLILMSQFAKGQASVELLNSYNKSGQPELYLKYKLQDTIFSKHEGLKLKNFASAKFEVSKNGVISNIQFSIFTDSLLRPYITDVLMSTNHRWIIKKNGKTVKEKVTIILPMIFTLRPRVIKKITTREEGPFNELLEDIELEAMHLFHFDKRYKFRRSTEKFDGIVLDPVDVTVPNDPDANDY